MERDERERLRNASEEAARWLAQACSVLAHRSVIEKAGDEAVAALRRRTVEVRIEGGVAWRVLPLLSTDSAHLDCAVRQEHLPRIRPEERRFLDSLTTDVPAAIDNAKDIIGLRRIFLGPKKREAGANAAAFLFRYWEWAHSAGLPQLIDRLGGQDDSLSRTPVAAALTDRVGLGRRLADLGSNQHLLPVTAPSQLPDAVETIDATLRREARFRATAVEAGELVRKHEVRRLLSDMPVERLKEATRDRLRIGPLTEAGLNTVQAVLDRGNLLAHLPGIGQTSATRMRGAAQTLWQTTYDETPVRIDIKNRTSEGTELLRRLAAWDAIKNIKSATTDLALKDSLTPLARALPEETSHIVVFAVDRTVDEFTGAVQTVVRLARQGVMTTSTDEASDPWEDFFRRPADYFAMLSELGFITEDEQKAHGELPDDIVEAVRRLELDTQYLTASLRGYQSFGARFALVQGKVIIGDEMGLGKTIEALAVLAHLRSKGAHHSLVICPAAVVTNWVREIRAKSKLRPHRLHGPGRDAAALGWVRNGGVAVTTFETLIWIEPYVRTLDALACVVIDEAHYIKNPAAQRSRRAVRIIDLAERAIMLTGTPLENRIDEFRTLVGYLRPDLVVDGSGLAPKRFRRQVAPAYLRRNQEDVLTELPELVEVPEWLPFSTEDEEAYFDAVVAGNFMAMRRAAMASGHRSEKMQRLIEIVQEAEDNRRRVIVFSQFRDVLDQVASALPGKVYGPLTGSVPAAARQNMVDEFSDAGHGAVLVSQIVAGGVGLNIQAASVVVICEPQLKPTTEWQAIARARRMGQLESVQVHRLLSEEGVDRRITEILARKQQLFEDFARVSATADSAPEAFDISEAELARDIVAAEKERLLAQPLTGSLSSESIATDSEI